MILANYRADKENTEPSSGGTYWAIFKKVTRIYYCYPDTLWVIVYQVAAIRLVLGKSLPLKRSGRLRSLAKA